MPDRSGEITGRFDQRLDWFGTVRGRVGFANGPVLRYCHRRLRLWQRQDQHRRRRSGAFRHLLRPTRTRGGWTVGSGVEAALGGNWTAKIEYLYLNLGNKSDTFVLAGFPQTLDTEIRENIFRVGLNYRIGGNGAYAPVAGRELDRLLSRRQFRLRPRRETAASLAVRGHATNCSTSRPKA